MARFLISWSFGENRLGGEKPDSDSFSCHLPRTKEKAEFVSGWAPLRGLNQGLGSSRQDRPVQLPRDPDARSRSGFRSEYPAGHRGAGESPQHQTQVFTTSQPVGRLFEGGWGRRERKEQHIPWTLSLRGLCTMTPIATHSYLGLAELGRSTEQARNPLFWKLSRSPTYRVSVQACFRRRNPSQAHKQPPTAFYHRKAAKHSFLLLSH